MKEKHYRESQSRCHERGTEPPPRIVGKNRITIPHVSQEPKAELASIKHNVLGCDKSKRTLLGEIKRN